MVSGTDTTGVGVNTLMPDVGPGCGRTGSGSGTDEFTSFEDSGYRETVDSATGVAETVGVTTS